jgi:hypothetical protein
VGGKHAHGGMAHDLVAERDAAVGSGLHGSLGDSVNHLHEDFAESVRLSHY